MRTYRIMRFTVFLGILTAFFLGNAGMTALAAQKSESAGQYIDDSAITTKVKAALFDEPNLKSMQIKVKTYKGTVQLTGFVDDSDSVKRAEDVAQGVAGVKSVKNDLIVKKQ